MEIAFVVAVVVAAVAFVVVAVVVVCVAVVAIVVNIFEGGQFVVHQNCFRNPPLKRFEDFFYLGNFFSKSAFFLKL